MSLMVWLGGFLFVLLRFASAYGAIIAVVRRSRLVATPAWRASLARLTNRTDIALRISADIPSPFTIGLIGPTIVLSADAVEWSDDRRDAILSHEIAHVERGDVATQSIGLFACSLLWFHPLAWFALAQLRREAESAADDRVIDTGASPISYAVHLVEIARGLGDSASRLPVAVGMGTPPLEKRIRAMLDRTRSRRGVSARARILGLSAALSAMFPVGGLEFARTFRPTIRPVVNRVEARSAAQPLNVPKQAPARPVPTTDVQNTLITAHDSVVPSLSTDSVPTAGASPEQPARLGLHPDFSGVWVATGDSAAFVARPILSINQTPSTITETIDRHILDEFGRDRGILHATLRLDDGTPAQAELTANGQPARLSLFAMSWEADTLMIRTAQLARAGVSGAVERLWLTADGRGMVAHTAPFGYIVNDEVTDTLWRRR